MPNLPARSSLRILYQVIRADFLQRTRGYAFLITLGLTLFAAYLALPSTQANYFVLRYYHYRGVYNSAWVGTVVAIVTAMFLPLLGFFVVKNTIERDRISGVGQILTTTRLSRTLYILGKVLSNFLVLLSIVLILTVAAGLMQLMLGEDSRVNPGQLIAPFLWVVLPSILVVSCLAVLFEIIPWLRGGFGNIVYFFLYTFLLEQSMDSRYTQKFNLNLPVPTLDVFGVSMPFRALFQAFAHLYPAGYKIRIEMFGPVLPEEPLQTIPWNGIPVSPEMLAQRLGWLILSGVLIAVVVLLFGRFDFSEERLAAWGGFSSWLSRFIRRQKQAIQAPQAERPERNGSSPSAQITASRLSPISHKLRFLPLLQAELRLMLNQLPWWWWLVAGGLWIASLFSPASTMLVLLWAWPLLIWSGMGTRERRHNTTEILFSCPRLLTRQIPAIWLAGVMITVLFGSGVALRMLFTGDWAGIVGWAAAALLIPSLALCCGVWSGSTKLFEVLYLLLWFIGEVRQDYWFLDFMGLTKDALSRGLPVYVLIITAVLLLLVLFRRTQPTA